MEVGKYCLNCGYIFRGQRTGKCPNCDQSAATENGRLYRISQEDIRHFEEFDRNGSASSSPQLFDKDIALFQAPERGRGKWVSLSVLGTIITYADYGQGPEIIFAQKESPDGFGLEDFPEKTLAKAAAIAAKLIAAQ